MNRARSFGCALLSALVLASALPVQAVIPTSERDALLALYTATNGAGWTVSTGWGGAVGTECFWFGVACDVGQNNVVSLLLQANNLNGSLPAAIGDLDALTILDLYGNQIGGTIPTAVGNMASLEWLYLNWNQLTGSIPAEIGGLANLTRLYLDGNQLTGSIPPVLGTMTSLEHVNLGGNPLDPGPIPDFSGLSSLHQLLLWGTQRNGTIPTWLGSLSNLGFLILGGNQLEGNIPPELAGATGLLVVDLASNQLTGTIPSELGSLSGPWGLNFSGNALTGSVPAQLGNLGTLQELRLSSNQLTGTIPSELGSLAGLQHLDLSSNQLTGAIPVEVSWPTNMLSLDLSSNRLSGQIPPQLGNLYNLTSLALGSNLLAGQIPASLGSLTLLTQLDLASNQLTGAVPAGLPGVGPDSLRWNGLLDGALPWDATQTVAPLGVAVPTVGSTWVLVSWTPIPFLANDGGYRVYSATNPGGPFTEVGVTADKSASSMRVEGLSPGTTAYYRVEAFTEPHADNQGTVVSDPSPPVPGTTAPAGSPGSVQLSLDAYRGSEGEAKVITVRRVGGSFGAASVLYSTSPGTATAGSDYTPTSEWLSWTSGDEEPRTFTVQLLDDADPEGEETLSVSLSNPSGATLGSPSAAVLTIDDNDLADGSEGQVNSGGSEPGIAADPNGSRLVVWTEQGSEGLEVSAQRYGPSGTSVGDRITVNTTALGDQRAPAVGAAASGAMVVTFVGDAASGEESQGGAGVFGRLFGPGGNPQGPQIQLNGTNFNNVTTAGVGVMPTSGSFVVAWHGTAAAERQGGGIFGRVFGSGGTPLSPQTVFSNPGEMVHAPAVGVNDSGTWVVAWAREDDLGWDDVFVQRADASGNLVGPQIQVNVDTYRHQTAPAVGVEPDGAFVVLWEGPSLDRQPGADVFLRRFAADGTPAGDAVLVNATVAGSQHDPRLVMNGAGDCWAVWEEDTAAGGVAVVGRVLEGCVVPTGAEVTLSDATGNPTLRHTVAALSDGGALTAVYVKDDPLEGDGSVVGFSVDQPEEGWLFGDGFERGNTAVWSVAIP